jgi:uncharacterized protein YdeI (YjbR/CyaY-like superfamily)
MEFKNGVKTFYAKSRKAWHQWLVKNGDTEKSVWLILYKKASGTPTLTYGEAVEEALCFGWIDSKPNKRDDQSFYLFFAQRKPASNWSKINKERVQRLLQQGLMRERGLAVVREAKRNGAWTALEKTDALIVPDDLQKALAKNKKAAAFFAAFPPSVKKGILEWISNAKREETRKKRIDETTRLAAQNTRANQYRPASKG